MAEVKADLARFLLAEHFGSIVSQVGYCLQTKGPSPLRLIALKTEIPTKRVKTSLLTLIQHRMVSVTLTSKGFNEYALCFDNVYQIIRYSKYIVIARNMFDEGHKDVAEFVLTEILKEGQITIRKLVTIFESLPESDLTLQDLETVVCKLCQEELISVTQDLRDHSFQDRLERPDLLNEEVTTSVPLVKNLFEAAAHKTVITQEGPSTKKQKVSKTNTDGIFWGIKFDRFNQIIRDEEVVKGFKRKYGLCDEIGMTVQSILKTSASKTNVSSSITTEAFKSEIWNFCQSNALPLTEDQLNQSLEVLKESSDGFILMMEKILGGGSYSVAILRILEKMTEDTVASIVEHKFGSRAARIFRIVASKKMLPQKFVEEMAMMPPKDCKEIMFTLVKAGFFRTNYYSKVVDYAPAKTFFVYSIDWDQVVRMVMLTCYKSILNVSRRREFEFQQNKLLIEKKCYVEQQIAQLSQQEGTSQQIEDLKGYFTDHDLQLIASSENASRKLHLAELKVDQTLFLIDTWLRMKREETKTTSTKSHPNTRCRKKSSQ